MKDLKSTVSKSTEMLEALNRVSKKYTDRDFGKDDETFYARYSLASEEGQKFYKGLSDEILLNVLKETANELGYPPSRKEIFWVWSEYIKVRFKKWPNALILAGLPKSAGSGGISLERAQKNQETKELVVEIIRQKAKSLGRLPHPSELPEVYETLINMRCPWNEAISAAQLDQDFFRQNSLYKIECLDDEDKRLLNELLRVVKQLGRAPRKQEVEHGLKERLISRCGTWRNALYQIGLEPVRSIKPFALLKLRKNRDLNKLQHKKSLQDCYYRVINLDKQTIKYLIYVKNLGMRLGHLPEKNEVPPEVRRRLQDRCGSWANALFQLQYLKALILKKKKTVTTETGEET